MHHTIRDEARPDDPLVDVGIPAYRPGFLAEAIESVLAQSFASWRLTVSEDGAGDGDVAAVIAPYLADPRVRHLPTGARIGQMANWTRLVSLTEAPFVALLHDDDRWHRDFLDRRISFMQAHSSCGLVFSPTREIDENGNAVGYLDPGFEEGLHTAETLLPLLVRRNVIGHPVSVIARRAAYETVGMAFNTDFPYADYEMWFRIVLRFPVGYVDVADADYRLHAMSTRVLEPHDRQLELRLLDHLIDLAERERPGVLSRRDRRRPRSDVLLALALDTVVDAQRRRSLRYLLEAIHTYPLSALDPRVGVWLVAIPLGRLGSRMVRSGRSFVRRHPIRRHIRSV